MGVGKCSISHLSYKHCRCYYYPWDTELFINSGASRLSGLVEVGKWSELTSHHCTINTTASLITTSHRHLEIPLVPMSPAVTEDREERLWPKTGKKTDAIHSVQRSEVVDPPGGAVISKTSAHEHTRPWSVFGIGRSTSMRLSRLGVKMASRVNQR